MPQLPIDKLKAGMIVTEKVANDKGMVLLPPGTTISEALIERLKKWNIKTVACQGETGEDDPSQKEIFQQPKMDANLENHLKEKFAPLINDPIMSLVYKALIIYYQNEQQKEGQENNS